MGEGGFIHVGTAPRRLIGCCGLQSFGAASHRPQARWPSLGSEETRGQLSKAAGERQLAEQPFHVRAVFRSLLHQAPFGLGAFPSQLAQRPCKGSASDHFPHQAVYPSALHVAASNHRRQPWG